jgi:hypothetical protein
MPILDRFKSADTAKSIQKELDADRIKLSELEKQLLSVETVLPELEAAAQALAFDGDIGPKLDAAEAKIFVGHTRLHTLNAAIGQLRTAVGNGERKIAELIDKALRKKTNAESLVEIAGFEAEIMEYEDIVTRLTKRTERLGVYILDFKPLHNYFVGGGPEVYTNAKFISQIGRDFFAAVLQGNGPASLPQPERVKLVEKPAVQLERLFLLQPCMFTANDQLQRVNRFMPVDLTPTQAAHALRVGVAVQMDDPRVAANRDPATQQRPEAHQCWSLDTGEPPTHSVMRTMPTPGATYQPPSNFAPTDRASDMRLPRAAASRAEPPQAGVFEPLPGKDTTPYQVAIDAKRAD